MVAMISKYKQKIRLPEEDILAIKTVFHQNFHEGDTLWIFGSRVDLAKKGGDIDIYIEHQYQIPEKQLKVK
jgi:hypothetical protein